MASSAVDVVEFLHGADMFVPANPLAHIADSHGVLLRREALAAGIDDAALWRFVRQRAIVRLRQGAYCLREVYLVASEAERHRLLCRAVMRLYGGHVALSHASSCLVQGGPDYGLDLGSVHLTHMFGNGRRQARVVHHAGELRVGDLRRHRGWWVSTPARAVSEVTCVDGSEAGLVQANHFLHLGLTTPEELHCQFEAHREWPGSLSQHTVALLATKDVESVGESRSLWSFWNQGLPIPQAQFEVRFPDGTLAARVDFAWPHLKLIVEFDGQEKYHRYRREGETIEQMVMREKKREDLVRRLTGWTVIRLTWRDLQFPARTAAMIRAEFRVAA